MVETVDNVEVCAALRRCGRIFLTLEADGLARWGEALEDARLFCFLQARRGSDPAGRWLWVARRARASGDVEERPIGRSVAPWDRHADKLFALLSLQATGDVFGRDRLRPFELLHWHVCYGDAPGAVEYLAELERLSRALGTAGEDAR